MTGLRRRLVWLPPFLLGTVGAVAAELAGGLLLYTGRGFLRSLTAVVATELLGLALGLASSRHLEAGDLGAVRRRWLMVLLAYAGAAGFAAAWSMGSGFAAAPPAQALGLGLLGAFPLFSVGSALGALPVAGETPGGVGAPAALGGAAGVVATGVLGMPSFEPTSLLLFCVIAVSVAALVHGWQVDGRVVVRVLAESRPRGDGPVLRLEERIRGESEERARLVSVDGRPAAGMMEGGGALLPWERTAAELVRGWAGAGERILVVGAAGGGLLRALESTPGRGDLVILEPWDRVRSLRPSGASEEWRPESSFLTRWPDTEPGSSYDAVIVALRLLPGGGAAPGAGLALLESVAAARSPDGLLLLGGVDLGAGDDARETARWIAGRPWSPSRLVLFRPSTGGGGPVASVLRHDEGRGGGLIFGEPDGAVDAGVGAVSAEMEPVEVLDPAAAEARAHPAAGTGEADGSP